MTTPDATVHPALARQMKRSFGAASEAQLRGEIAALRQFLASRGAPPALLQLAEGFDDFIGRVNGAYLQFERDLELRSRSLQLSSSELLGINDKLRQELDSRERAIAELRRLAGRLQSTLAQPAEGEGEDRDSIPKLLAQVSSLIDQQEVQRAQMQALHSDLANQKFAVDQHAIVSITDLQGRITYANDRFCELSGYSREELVGANHRIVKSGFHPPGFYADLWETISSGRVWHGEIENRRRNGEPYWVAATIVPMTDAGGLINEYIAIRTDITERKRIEAELAEQLHFTEVLIEALPTALYFKDTQGRYRRVNRAFEALFGVDRADWIGKTVRDLVPGSVSGLIGARDEELLRDGGVQSYEAHFVNRQSGETHGALVWKARMTRPDGAVTGLVGAILDISERKRFEQEMQDARLAAEAANRAKSEFLANMSHEIRTPMNGIIGMTELALDTELDPTPREYLNIVRSSAEALLVILNDILDFSKIEAGKLNVENIPFNLPVTIAEALKSIAARAEKKGLRLVCNLPAELPAQVAGDPGRIRQVLTNLCDNAIKFTERGEITVLVAAAASDGEHCRVDISVADSGIGIAPEKQERIFEAFTQADSSTTRRFGGTGLGLTICARLVRLMGGTIAVESELGRGSTFRFSVRLRCRGAGLEADPALPPLTNWPGVPALVVDDHPVNRRCLAHWLRTWGFEVDEAGNGREALDKCRDGGMPYRVIFLDANMPELDGFGFAEALRGEGLCPQAQVVMLTSGGAKGDAKRCRDLGLGGYLTKPATPVELRETLTRILVSGNEASAAGGQARFVTRHSLREQRRRLSILLVEDHPVNQELAIRMFEKWGHAVTLAQNGREAVDLFPEGQWDLVFMDMQMPVMGGIEATRLIRAQEPPGRRTLIIAMTASAMADDRQRCFDAGMDDYIAKPITLRAVQAVLDRYHAFAAGSEDEQEPAAAPSPAAGEIETALATVDPEIMSAIAEAVVEQLPRDIAAAIQAGEARDWEVLRRSAHNMKSTFGLFGLDGAVETAQLIEASPSDASPRLLAELEATVFLLVNAIGSRLAGE